MGSRRSVSDPRAGSVRTYASTNSAYMAVALPRSSAMGLRCSATRAAASATELAGNRQKDSSSLPA